MSFHQTSLSAVPTSGVIKPVDVAGQYGEASYTETRKVSSVVVESTILGEVPQQDVIKYVEVPTVEEKIKYVTVHEVREVEKKVPKYEYEWVERIVEKPVIVEKKREVEVVQFVDDIVRKEVKQIVERPVEVVKEIHVPKIVQREVIIDVPGEVIEVPKPYTVEVPVEVPHPVDKKVPVIVSQTVKPVIIEGGESMVVDVLDYEPEVIPVDVHIAKPVASALKFVGQTDAKHRVVNVSAAQYNTILRQLNVHMDEKMKSQLPFVSENNTVPFASDVHYIVAPDNVWHEFATTATATHSKRHELQMGVREVQAEEFSQIHGDQKKKSRQCCNNADKSKTTLAPVAATSVHGSHISHHSVHSGAHPAAYYKAGEPSLATHTIQTTQTQSASLQQQQKEIQSSTTSYTEGPVSSHTGKRHETASQMSLGPQQVQTKQRVCC